jgi:hypothetical protein
MTFDDQLRQAFDTLSDRLRRELDREMQAAMDELAATAREERDSAVQAAVASARAERQSAAESERASARVERESALEAALAAARQERDAAVETALATARQERDAAVETALATARQERDAAVEGALATARQERDAAVETALVTARQERDAAVAAAAAAAAPPPADEPHIIVSDRLEQVAAGVRAMSAATSLTAVLETLMSAAAASGAMTNIWLVRGRELEPWRPSAVDAPPPPVAIDADNPIAEVVRSKAPASRDDVVASPLLLAGEVVAVLVTASPQPPAPSLAALDVLALYASRALESITAFKTARALTQRPDTAAAAATAGTVQPAVADAASEEQAAAQRYARLLVSEIKLYHEADVVSGRRERDLMLRLGGEIARARVMYEQRVPPNIRRHADYFHDELVRTLANGDPSLLEVRT